MKLQGDLASTTFKDVENCASTTFEDPENCASTEQNRTEENKTAHNTTDRTRGRDAAPDAAENPCCVV
jgi:hypothetical protein